jgi:hypothetical protein
MKIYYVGNLYENNSTDYSKFVSNSSNESFDTRDLKRINLKIDYEDFDYLISNLRHHRTVFEGISDKRLIRILNNSDLSLFRGYSSFSSVIFEIIESEDGTKYGKEIITGLLFPLELNPKTKYFYGRNGAWKLEMERTYTDDNLARFRYILSINEVASLNEIERYKSKSTRDLNDFIRNLTTKHNEIVFKKKIIEKETEPLKEQNILTKLMEEIEYLLQLLKQHNVDVYNKLSLEYKNLLNDNNDSLVATDPSKKELQNFLANVKLTLLVNENKKDSLSEYLTDAAVRYFNRLNSNELSNQDLNIKDIDVLTEMFLSNKHNYTAIEQRNILTKFSMLYLFITKANINNINIEDLKESYFSKNLKTIILLIFELHDINIVTNPINISSNDNITIEKVIEIIKSIQFNKIENDKIKNLTK